MDDPNPSEEPNLNTGTPWSSWDDQDIRWGLDHHRSIEEIANFLCRTAAEIRQRIVEIAEADAIGCRPSAAFVGTWRDLRPDFCRPAQWPWVPVRSSGLWTYRSALWVCR